MIQIVSKKHRVTHELQGTDMSSTNKGDGIYNLKKGCRMNRKKDLEEFLRRKISLGENLFTFPSRIQRILNNTWGFIQLFFLYLYRTANSIVHLTV